jgi:hypothetical protein
MIPDPESPEYDTYQSIKQDHDKEEFSKRCEEQDWKDEQLWK